jgi:hypothetical protein
LPWLKALQRDPTTYFSRTHADTLGLITTYVTYMSTMPGVVDNTLELVDQPMVAFRADDDDTLAPNNYHWLSLDMDNDGNYVALAEDMGSSQRLMAFCSPDGELLRSVPLIVCKEQTTTTPLYARTMSVDRRTGRIAVCAPEQSLVQLYHHEGTHLATLHFPESSTPPLPRSPMDVFRVTPLQDGPHISSVTFDSHDGTLVVCDDNNRRLLVYTPDGQRLLRTIDMCHSITHYRENLAVAVCPCTGRYVLRKPNGDTWVLARDGSLVNTTVRVAFSMITSSVGRDLKLDGAGNVVLHAAYNNQYYVDDNRGRQVYSKRIRPPATEEQITAMREASACTVTPNGDLVLLTSRGYPLPLLLVLKKPPSGAATAKGTKQ